MTISELITALQLMKYAFDEHGDLLITAENHNAGWNHIESIELIPECKDGPKRFELRMGEWVIDSSDGTV